MIPGTPRVGSAVLVTDGDKVLLGRRGKQPNFGRWVLPGGKVELFEPLDEAAQRETAEETGLNVAILERVGVFEIIDREEGEHRLIVFSRAQPLAGTLRPGDDLLEVKFVGRQELLSLDLTPVVRAVLIEAGWLDSGETALRSAV